MKLQMNTGSEKGVGVFSDNLKQFVRLEELDRGWASEQVIASDQCSLSDSEAKQTRFYWYVLYLAL